ncbi:hypothetical protein FHL15_011122 [Xylaria flabelliformis]|uniref:Cellobiose dehydrogenase-like cytochrome domain-containing protein n=1 Tax=Xylaria flabelliformis TaxID=2512241 RepID=A0A553HJ56_9PEZI|nr:hypothetical protein FHL15_011122 [Xylaria flabelliformis]
MVSSSILCTVALALASIVGAAQYCDPVTTVCYSETKAGDLYVRVALPAVEKDPFDILMQIVAPKAAAGWAAVAWGGKMTKNPITVAWANGNQIVVSSRWADQCASWTADNAKMAINPNDTAAKFAYALAPTPPSQPANNASSIVKHTIHASFTVDLAAAKTEKFEDYVKALSSGRK